MKILPQLKQANCKAFKKQGKWINHYTMTLWQNADAITTFARSGAHLEAMKKSAEMAKEIRTLTIDADQLIDWKTAKKLLKEEGKLLTY